MLEEQVFRFVISEKGNRAFSCCVEIIIIEMLDHV